jgi:hypothetical protein
MRISIELNGVLRDTIGKITQVYQKHMIEGYQDHFNGKTYMLNLSGKTEENIDHCEFEYKILSDVTTGNLMNHYKFQSEDELYDFLYKEHTMEIFGHAGSVEVSGMLDLNEFYLDMRDDHEITIVSDEIGKSKPASLFFISKFGCLIESIRFYSDKTINSMWDHTDIIITANPKILSNIPPNKIAIKYNTKYNSDIECDYSISSIKQLKELILTIYD